ncbi:GAF domain-containing SpoIIE family protein phosphatase [Streptacidiphilus rugosus]|uniref:GAF domain-containing SpoIIE family protein phosphatase n=1 Tax=Streptacidiphilus rugosus TaxID=405783 RepID=UPI00068F0648|nr:GAF domain-containing SpoIIE family protein phosphatase [Streptacidiphilus rugosus]
MSGSPLPGGRPTPADGRPERGSSDPGGVGSGIRRLSGTVQRVHEALPVPSEAADARALVDCAVGILMERTRRSAGGARELLDTMAAASESGVLQTAAELVARASRPGPAGTHQGAPSEVSGEARADGRSAPEVQQAAKALLDNALEPLGAHAVALWAQALDGTLHLAGQAGFAPGSLPERQAHAGGPTAVPTVAQEAARTGELCWSAPDGPPPSSPPCHTTPRAAVAAYLDGQVVGILEVCWAQPPTPDVRLERQLEALANLAARLITDGAQELPVAAAAPDTTASRLAESLPDPVMVLVPAFDTRGRLADFTIAHTNNRFRDLAGRPATLLAGRLLRQAYPAFTRPGGVWEKIEHVFATGEPYRSEDFPLHAQVGDVGVTIRAHLGISRINDTALVTWRLLDENAQRLGTLLQHAQRLGRIGGFEDDLVHGRTTWNDELYDLFGRSPADPPLPLSEVRARIHEDDRAGFDLFTTTVTHFRKPASVALRVRRGDHVIRHVRLTAEAVVDHAGELVAVRGACQDVSAHHWTEVALEATRDQLARSEADARDRARLARQLQHAIMPATPQTTEVRGLDIAVRYRPASQDEAVGGDWYDAVELPNGTVLIAVGDVAGHGIGAATGMVALRNALRGLAATGAGPAQLLSWLNNVAFHLTDNVTATAICAIFDPDTRCLHWARAGHLPPVLLADGVPSQAAAGPGILLGALPDAVYQEQQLELTPGQTLFLFTDGLIERKDDTGQGDLLDTLRDPSFPADRPLPDQLDHLLAHSLSDTDDDTCLIGVRIPPV